MTRGCKPRPSHLKLIEGNPGKRPIRVGPQRPTTAMPEPPDQLNTDARTEWDRVTHGLHALRPLETVDCAVLSAYCLSHARWVHAERTIAEMGTPSADAPRPARSLMTTGHCVIQQSGLSFRTGRKSSPNRHGRIPTCWPTGAPATANCCPTHQAVQQFPRREVAFGRETLAACARPRSAGPGSIEAARQPTHQGNLRSVTASTIIPFKAIFCNVVIFNQRPHPGPNLRKPLA